jgi:thioesterase domain-containing protein
VQTEFGVRLALIAVFNAPTVAELSLRLEDAGHGTFDPILPIAARGSLPPLFCIHPAGGLSWCYANLAKHLGDERPLWGLQAHDAKARPETLRTLSLEYLALIRTIQPAGPYHLLGWSFGGLMAHEIACRIREQGEGVAFLGLLDSDPGTLADTPLCFDDAAALGQLLESAGYPAASLEAERPTASSTALAHLRSNHLVPAEFTAADLTRWLNHLRRNTELNAAAVPAHFDGDMLYLAAVGETPDTTSRHDAWRRLIGGRLAIERIDTAHRSMLDEGPAAQVGRILRARLDQLAMDHHGE